MHFYELCVGLTAVVSLACWMRSSHATYGFSKYKEGCVFIVSVRTGELSQWSVHFSHEFECT